ncbi:hypothetical protein MSG28_015317 [Choristoneura fumiferana]|uniref:Uncharacterized protein n=1 Tax=Choristoneura fumiferana TaxID=7141 RepID=A0ACC0K9S6_CHOFU|nr:hypothetical protein MSG28_015317 [Choristoneura fumiferana]
MAAFHDMPRNFVIWRILRSAADMGTTGDYSLHSLEPGGRQANSAEREGNMFLPFMQGMMQSLLSKEVLYPSLKELVDKYPAWLEENKGKVSQDEYDRYCKQQELMLQVCSELEPEQESDPDDVKRKRFEVVLDLMQKIERVWGRERNKQTERGKGERLLQATGADTSLEPESESAKKRGTER